MMPNYVTIDDKITRVHLQSVSLEIVERSERTGFYTADSSVRLEYDSLVGAWLVFA